MNFSEDIIITQITHASVVNYKSHERSKMNMRPWYGIAFSLGGELIYFHNSNKILLSDNQVVFIPKNTSYEVLCTKPGSFAVINFLTAQELNVNEFIITQAKNIDILKSEFSIMHNFFISESTQRIYNNMSSLYKMFSVLTSDFSQNSIPYVLRTALSYIDNNIGSTTLSNTQIAEYLGISEVYLRKLFSANLSISVNHYIQNKRIEKAKLLLVKTYMSITDIAEKCGYSCIYYFCNCFKQKVGCTPTQYRQNNSFVFF